MTGIPLIRAVVLAPVVAFLDRRGAPAERLLARANLRREMLAHPEGLVPLALCTRFLETAARDVGDGDLCLQVMRDVDVATLGTFGRIVSQARTLGDALTTAHHLYRHWSTGERYWLTRDG